MEQCLKLSLAVHTQGVQSNVKPVVKSHKQKVILKRHMFHKHMTGYNPHTCAFLCNLYSKGDGRPYS